MNSARGAFLLILVIGCVGHCTGGLLDLVGDQDQAMDLQKRGLLLGPGGLLGRDQDEDMDGADLDMRKRGLLLGPGGLLGRDEDEDLDGADSDLEARKRRSGGHGADFEQRKRRSGGHDADLDERRKRLLGLF